VLPEVFQAHVSFVVCGGGIECDTFVAVFWGCFVTFIAPFALALYPFSVVFCACSSFSSCCSETKCL